jgi:uncharacterized protein (TIGR02569 family)
MDNSIHSTSVLRAYGLSGSPVPLGGGQGQSVQVGEAVLKPVDDAVEAEWIMGIQHELLQDKHKASAYRLAEPIMAADGHYVVNGWSAARLIPGQPGPKGRWKEVLDASRAFHTDLKSVVSEPPAFLARRNHRWAKADRVAWSEDVEHGWDIVPGLDGVFRQLMGLRESVPESEERPQLIHGDLTGNVLLTSNRLDLAPAIIDFSPYWRPVEYAEAMLVADGLLDFDEDEELIDLVGSDRYRLQMLVRALIFRVVAWSGRCKEFGPLDEGYEKSFERAVQLVRSLILMHRLNAT